MNERKYSVGELDALRMAVENKWLWGNYRPVQVGRGSSRQYTSEEKTAAVEYMVRTHLLAGHTAEDLYASEQPAKDGAE